MKGKIVAVGFAALIAWIVWGWIFGSGGGMGGFTPTRVAVFGDSLTSGIPEDSGATPWVDLLAAANGYDVQTFAFPGDTVEASRSRWSEAYESGIWSSDGRGWKPELVIMLLGGNDIRSNAAPEQIERRLGVSVDLLLARGARVLLIAVPGGLLTDRYEAVWRNVAKDREGVYVMPNRGLRGIFTDRRLTLDGIHMNAAGHEQFAAAVAEWMRK